MVLGSKTSTETFWSSVFYLSSRGQNSCRLKTVYPALKSARCTYPVVAAMHPFVKQLHRPPCLFVRWHSSRIPVLIFLALDCSRVMRTATSHQRHLLAFVIDSPDMEYHGSFPLFMASQRRFEKSPSRWFFLRNYQTHLHPTPTFAWTLLDWFGTRSNRNTSLAQPERGAWDAL